MFNFFVHYMWQNSRIYEVGCSTNAAFTLNGFDDQERNLTFVKTNFQNFKLKFHACNYKQAFYPLHNYISCDLDNTKILL